MHKPTTTALVLAAVLGGSMLAGDSAHADDRKSYPGNVCNERGGSTSNFTRYTSMISRTQPGGDGWLFCPIIRDTGYRGLTVRPVVKDLNFSQDISCSVSVRNLDSTQVEWKSVQTEYAPGVVEELELKFIMLPFDYYATLACNLPANSGSQKTYLYAYEVLEH